MNSIVKCCLVRSNPLFPCGACALERERVHRLVYLDGFFLQQQQQVASKVFSFKCFGDGIFWCHFIRLNTCAIACINFARPFVVANVGNRAPFTLVPLRFSMENLDVFVRSFVFIFLVHSFSHTKIYVEFDKDKMARLFRSFHID